MSCYLLPFLTEYQAREYPFQHQSNIVGIHFTNALTMITDLLETNTILSCSQTHEHINYRSIDSKQRRQKEMKHKSK